MIIPNTWNTLEEFAQWYKDNNYPIRVPNDCRIYPTEMSYSCCVFKQDVYQVEIYLARPNSISSKHSHNFEQIIIPLGGDITGTREGYTKFYKETDFNIIRDKLPKNTWHQIISGPRGFIFFNLQKWRSIDVMTSAVVEYQGKSLGPIHEEIIKKNI